MMPIELKELLEGHEVVHSAEMGWEKLTNGHLLTKAETENFQVLITKDRQMIHQQNFAGRTIGLLVFRSLQQGRGAMLRAAPELAMGLESVKPGTCHVVTLTNPSDA